MSSDSPAKLRSSRTRRAKMVLSSELTTADGEDDITSKLRRETGSPIKQIETEAAVITFSMGQQDGESSDEENPTFASSPVLQSISPSSKALGDICEENGISSSQEMSGTVENGADRREEDPDSVTHESSPNPFMSEVSEQQKPARHSDMLVVRPKERRVVAGSPVDSGISDGVLSMDAAQVEGSGRFNPFDRDIVIDEDRFANTPPENSPVAKEFRANSGSSGSHGLTSKSDRTSSKSSDDSESWPESCTTHDTDIDEELANAALGLTEDHFSRPDGYFGMSRVEELEQAIENCKDLILEEPPHSDRRRSLIRKITQLRLNLVEIEDSKIEEEPNIKVILGHRFKKRQGKSVKYSCEQCNNLIWGMLQSWYGCKGCGCHCHGKCMNQLTRVCAGTKLGTSQLILQICPEVGISRQKYRCGDCRAQLFRDSEMRQCDYTGQYYCTSCHWNDTAVIPARVLHNWDFQPCKVARQSKQYLQLVYYKPLLNPQESNPQLFSRVEELDHVRKLRREVLIMKNYFVSCRVALEAKLLLKLKTRQHFVESSDMYSLHDLCETESGNLLDELTDIHVGYAHHIKFDCATCQGKGFICELCEDSDVLFPFDVSVHVCEKCSTVYHRDCFPSEKDSCPKCRRISQRTV
ncbi:DEF8 [Branchiostoma lanceolatum]|uniref:DEF8 protein n=1 Tax=Branchiostoma lanceolatum TaxID=7740 RepID=A0A8J9YKD8_BRALA|nr:DEF8 [Branchiostoma lanceolatum]